jgi:hypothetical protein
MKNEQLFNVYQKCLIEDGYTPSVAAKMAEILERKTNPKEKKNEK